jgi:hypothetical protein
VSGSISATSPPDAWDTVDRYRLIMRPTPVELQCRCGQRLKHGTPAFRFRSAPDPLTEVVRDVAFCCPACARAYLLESLEFSEAAIAAGAVSDLAEAVEAFRVLLAVLEIAGPGPAS